MTPPTSRSPVAGPPEKTDRTTAVTDGAVSLGPSPLRLVADEWLVAVEHVTRYHYRAPVLRSYNEARMTPATTSTQRPLTAAFETSPMARHVTYRDYFGTIVHAFEVDDPHDELVVSATSVTANAPSSAAAPRPSWAELTAPAVQEELWEYLGPTPTVPDDEELRAAARAAVGRADPADAVEALLRCCRDRLRYEAGATQVSTSAPDAWRARQGVCQDFAHVTLALLRACRIPARYVSGYLLSGDTSIGRSAVGESHAWIEAYLGTWCPYDPTAGLPVGPGHIAVGFGRDYHDVPPLKGVYQGGALAAMEVTVTVQRLA